MADFDNRLVRGAATAADTMDTGLRAHMLRVYNYMLAGLALTGAVAWLTANTAFGQIFYNHVLTANGTTALAPNILGWVAFLAPLGLTLLLSFRLQKMSFGAVQASYWAITALMGVQLAMILLIYTGASVATTFFVAAAMFGGMSLYGYTTGRDLTGMGSFLIMGVWGLLIAMLVTAFFPSTNSPAISFVINALGVVIFTGLTAYDTQKIKQLYYYVGNGDAAMAGKASVMGAFSLYLDFYNMFLFLLRLMGNRR
jgi:FtsH-binding integral membrane protein